jgi:hypothetical protein
MLPLYVASVALLIPLMSMSKGGDFWMVAQLVVLPCAASVGGIAGDALAFARTAPRPATRSLRMTR